MANPRITMTAAEYAEDMGKPVCQCCGKPLTGRVAMLELDQRTNTYHDHGGVPADKSQGWFPFGVTCAKAKLMEAGA